MAVRTITASESEQTGPHGPIRTCIGCRERAAAAELLRVVVARETDPAAKAVRVVPDPRHRAPGRGAHLHPDLACVELAQRRRAFARALRVSGTIDASPVHEYVAAAGKTDDPRQIQRQSPLGEHEHEQAMKPQR